MSPSHGRTLHLEHSLPEKHFRSLRYRLLGTLVLGAILAAALVAVASSVLGSRWAFEELQTRFDEIENTLAASAFPLNPSVLGSIAGLTQTELITFDERGTVRASTIAINPSDSFEVGKFGGEEIAGSQTISSVQLNERLFRVLLFRTMNHSIRSDQVRSVAVLFDEARIRESQRRAAALPLVTGLSTIVLLALLSFWMTSNLVHRVRSLQQRVERVAAGDFEMEIDVADSSGDEIGRLGGAVESMALQLSALWRTVNQQQSQKLLHQIAGGMAHQLRNSLTGARMAIELHARECPSADHESLHVAIAQMEQSEDYVRRLLQVGSGRQAEDRPMLAVTCLQDIRSSLQPIARHRRVDVDWQWDDTIEGIGLKDGPTWVAAVTNLVHNAMEVSDRVSVVVSIDAPGVLRVCVRDQGEGVANGIADEIFEPFVSTKPEGMGLGLAVVRRAAEYLDGKVRWYRELNETVFEFDVTYE